MERVQENHSGDLIVMEGDELLWTDWQDGQWRESKQKLKGGLLELDQTGVWRSNKGQRGVAHLLSFAETDVRSSNNGGVDRGAEQESQSALTQGQWGDVGKWILAALVFLLVIESWLFHRYAVY